MNCPHCGTEVTEHEAGDCLNLWVLDEVMAGVISTGRRHGDTVVRVPPEYSTHIEDAWQVVEKMMDRDDVFIEWWQDGEWFVSWDPLVIRRSDGSRVGASCDGQETGKPSAPLAICRAALLAAEAEAELTREDNDD